MAAPGTKVHTFWYLMNYILLF